MNIKGTKSEANIKAAFAGESQARNKYTYYAIQAQKEGLTDTAKLFELIMKKNTQKFGSSC